MPLLEKGLVNLFSSPTRSAYCLFFSFFSAEKESRNILYYLFCIITSGCYLGRSHMIATSPWRAAVALSAHLQEEKWLVIAVPWLLVDRNGHLTEWRIGWQEGDGRAEIEGCHVAINKRAHNETY
jgi:hypothetical protein